MKQSKMIKQKRIISGSERKRSKRSEREIEKWNETIQKNNWQSTTENNESSTKYETKNNNKNIGKYKGEKKKGLRKWNDPDKQWKKGKGGRGWKLSLL